MVYLNFDPMGVSSAHKLKMKHKKIMYFHHYVPWTEITDDMNSSYISALASKKRSNQKKKALYSANWRILF